MAIRLRRGAYSGLDATKLEVGEVVIVLEGDPGLSLPNLQEGCIEGDGTGVYVCTAKDTIKRLVSQTELDAVIGILNAGEPAQEE